MQKQIYGEGIFTIVRDAHRKNIDSNKNCYLFQSAFRSSGPEIGGNCSRKAFSIGKKSLKIHGKARNVPITEKLPGTDQIQAFRLDFKYYFLIGRPVGNVPADLCLQLKWAL